MSKYKGFYKKKTSERIEILKQENSLNVNYLNGLEKEIAENMVENYISNFEVPIGIAPQFLINNKLYNIPMATEESSVVAAASNGAKIIRDNGGITAIIKERLMQGEIIFTEFINKDNLLEFLNTKQDAFIEVANKAHPSIVNRGGGVREFRIREVDKFIILDVYMDTQEAMGANMLNTVLENISHYIEIHTEEKALMSILSNLTSRSLVKANCIIDPKTLKFGEEGAKKIALASDLAKVDKYRRATHNKGVMNGIDSVVLASGNDTRAVNAGIYAYHNNTPITTWVYKDNLLYGQIEIPLALGSVGGAISIHPKAKLAQSIMQYENVKELMMIVASVGLAQNFAALNALTTVGIQKGHMSLHAKNIAISAGCPSELLDQVTEALIKGKVINLETAKAIIKELQEN